MFFSRNTLLARHLFFVRGKTGIRTLGTRKGTTVFETAPFNRSGIFPKGSAKVRIYLLQHPELFLLRYVLQNLN